MIFLSILLMFAICFIMSWLPKIFFWWIEKGSRKYFAHRGNFNKRQFDTKDMSYLRGGISK